MLSAALSAHRKCRTRSPRLLLPSEAKSGSSNTESAAIPVATHATVCGASATLLNWLHCYLPCRRYQVEPRRGNATCFVDAIQALHDGPRATGGHGPSKEAADCATVWWARHRELSRNRRTDHLRHRQESPENLASLREGPSRECASVEPEAVEGHQAQTGPPLLEHPVEDATVAAFESCAHACDQVLSVRICHVPLAGVEDGDRVALLVHLDTKASAEVFQKNGRSHGLTESLLDAILCAGLHHHRREHGRKELRGT